MENPWASPAIWDHTVFPFHPLVFPFLGSRFPGTRDSRTFSFPDSRELKLRTSHRQLVIKWDPRQWLQRVQMAIIAGQLTAAGSRSTKQLCCVHYRVRLVAALQDSGAGCHPCLEFGLKSCSWHCVHGQWRYKCQRTKLRSCLDDCSLDTLCFLLPYYKCK